MKKNSKIALIELVVLTIFLSGCNTVKDKPYLFEHALEDYRVHSLNHVIKEQKVIYQHYENGQVKSESVSVYTYDRNGNLISYDHYGDGKIVTIYEYTGDLRTKSFLYNVNEEAPEVLRYFIYEDGGKLVRSEAARKSLGYHNYYYDDNNFCNKMEMFTDTGLGNGVELHLYFVYVPDSKNRVSIEKLYSPEDKLLRVTSYFYDENDRLSSIEYEFNGVLEIKASVLSNDKNNPVEVIQYFEPDFKDISSKTIFHYTGFENDK